MNYLYFRYRLFYCDTRAKIQYSNWFMYLTWKWNRWNMKKTFLCLSLFIASTILFIVSTVYAQNTVTSDAKIYWDQEASTLIEAQKYIYKYYLDNSTMGMVLIGVTCNGTVSPYQCQVAIPAFTYKIHSLTLTAKDSTNESPKSESTSFTFAKKNSDIPQSLKAPKNLVIR